MRRRGVGTALGVLAACAQATAAPDPPLSRAQAAGSDDAQAWQLFVAINAPADLGRGAPEPAKPAADRPVAWEHWRNSNGIFLKDGSDPGPWDAGGSLTVAAARFEATSTAGLANLKHIVGGRMVSVADPLDHTGRLIEVRMNRDSFEYLRAQGLYGLEGQLRVLSSRQTVRFPAGSIQLKAAWRPIRHDQQARYHTLWVTRADGRRVLYGLTALNIAFKDRPQWLWAAFEHEDNAHRERADGWQLPSHDTFACPAAEADCGRVPQGIGLEGVWTHYRLRGTMSTSVDGTGAPVLLASSELEAGLQRSSSCMTCHARASIGRSAGRITRLPVLTALDENNDLGGGTRRGYIGRPDPAWFQAGNGPRELAPLDFVWSLSRAAARDGATFPDAFTEGPP